ncbi:MAG: MATE family efflux transporter [Oscillospiraceae bacterium]|nr:MATE family efflux transporter [Oscillospiraceae bacterium]
MRQDFLTGNPGKTVLIFAVPMLIGNIFQQLYSTVDTIVVGNFVGKNAVAAVGGTFSIQFLVLSLAMGFTTGMSVVISQLYGARDYQRLQRAFSTSAIFSLLLSVVLGIVGILVINPLLTHMLQTPAEIYADSYTYLFITFIGYPFTLIYNMYSAVLRAVGDSKTPLYFLIISAVTNIILDLLLVIQFDMGVAGVAVATLIAQALSCVCCHIYVGRKYEIFQLTKNTLVFDKDLLKGIIKYGVPSAIQQSVLSLNFMVVQRFVNFFGADMTAAFSVVNKIENFVTMPQMNLAMALSMFAGQNIGAGEEKRAKQGVTDVLKIQAAFWAVIVFVLPLVAGGLISLFGMGDDAHVMAIGVEAIRLCSKLYILFAVMQTLSNFLRGVGDAKFSMVTTICMILIRLPITYVLVHIIHYGEMSIWLGMGMGWLTVTTMNAVRYLKGGWRGKAFVQAKKQA